MALSGVYSTPQVQNNFISFIWSGVTNSTYNSTTITWSLVAHGQSSVYRGTKLYLNNTLVFDESAGSYSNTDIISTGSITINHNNDGTKTVPVSINSVVNNFTLSGTYSFALDSISLGFTSMPIITSRGVTETAVSYAWTTSETCSKIRAYYKIDGGTWTGVDVYNNSTGAKSGTFLISGLNENTNYSIKAKFTRKDNNIDRECFPVSCITYQYPYIIDVEKRILETGQTQTVSLYNPLGRSCRIILTGLSYNDNTDINLSAVNTTSSSVTWTPNQSNIISLLENNGTGQVTCNYSCVATIGITSNTSYYNIPTSVRLQGAQCPIFTDFEIIDCNSNVTSVTNDASIIIQNESIIRVKISSDNKMTVPGNVSSPSYYEVIFLDKYRIIEYSISDVYVDFNFDDFNFNVSGNQTIYVIAYDNLEMSTAVSKTINIIPYRQPYLDIIAKRRNNFDTQTILDIKGTYSPILVNNQNKNTLSIKYRYKRTDDSYNSYTNVSCVYDNDTFSCSSIYLNLNNSYSWVIEVSVTDSFGENTVYEEPVGFGNPVFFISSNERKCYVNNKEILTEVPEFFSNLEIQTGDLTCNYDRYTGEGGTLTAQDIVAEIGNITTLNGTLNASNNGNSVIENSNVNILNCNNDTYINALNTNYRVKLGSQHSKGVQLSNNFTFDSNGDTFSSSYIMELWRGTANYMGSSARIQLSHSISNLMLGIVLHWQKYDSGVLNANHTYTFIPKNHVKYTNGGGIFCECGSTNGINGCKYVYVYDTYIDGDSANERTSFTSGGHTYYPKAYVLTEILGF